MQAEGIPDENEHLVANRRHNRNDNYTCNENQCNAICGSILLSCMLIIGDVLKIIYGLKYLDLGYKYANIDLPYNINHLTYTAGIIMFGCGLCLLGGWISTIGSYLVNKKDSFINHIVTSTMVLMPFVTLPTFYICIHLIDIRSAMSIDEMKLVNSIDTDFINFDVLAGISFLDLFPAIISVILIVGAMGIFVCDCRCN